MPAVGRERPPGVQILALDGEIVDSGPAVEVALTRGVGPRVEQLRSSGSVVAVVVPDVGPGADDVEGADGAAGRGAVIGLLTEALLAGATIVRTHDPRTARRVAAVVEALSGAAGDDARMGG